MKISPAATRRRNGKQGCSYVAPWRSCGRSILLMSTLFDKLWQAHIVREARGEPTLLYIDLHLIHEVTSPQAFEGLREAGRKCKTPGSHFRHCRSQRPHHRSQSADRGCDCRQSSRDTTPKLQRVWHSTLRYSFARTGHRSRYWTRAWTDAAGHDDRLRR